MKRLSVLILMISFIFSGSVFAAEITKASPVAPSAKTGSVTIPAKAMEKETKMSATGNVTEISDTMMKIDRHVKGNTETMEFSLEKACSNISAGDKVRVSYITQDNKNVAAKVTKIIKKAKQHPVRKAGE